MSPGGATALLHVGSPGGHAGLAAGSCCHLSYLAQCSTWEAGGGTGGMAGPGLPRLHGCMLLSRSKGRSAHQATQAALQATALGIQPPCQAATPQQGVWRCHVDGLVCIAVDSLVPGVLCALGAHGQPYINRRHVQRGWVAAAASLSRCMHSQLYSWARCGWGRMLCTLVLAGHLLGGSSWRPLQGCLADQSFRDVRQAGASPGRWCVRTAVCTLLFGRGGRCEALRT